MLEVIRSFLASVAVSFDLPILDWIQAHMQSPIMDKIWPIVTLFGDGGVFWILVALFLIVNPWDKFHKLRGTGIGMLVALIMGVLVCNVTLKPLIARIRPYALKEELTGNMIQLLVSKPHDWSFPSGHTIASFEACGVLMINDKRLGIPATVLAFLIAFSRLYLYVHYPTDVIFSFFFGILFAILGNLIVKAILKKYPFYVPKHLA